MEQLSRLITVVVVVDAFLRGRRSRRRLEFRVGGGCSLCTADRRTNALLWIEKSRRTTKFEILLKCEGRITATAQKLLNWVTPRVALCASSAWWFRIFCCCFVSSLQLLFFPALTPRRGLCWHIYFLLSRSTFLLALV